MYHKIYCLYFVCMTINVQLSIPNDVAVLKLTITNYYYDHIHYRNIHTRAHYIYIDRYTRTSFIQILQIHDPPSFSFFFDPLGNLQ